MHRIGHGRLQVITGPMFAGKSEELLRRVRRAQLAGLAVEVVNHALDQRHGTGTVASHTGLRILSHSAPDVAAVRKLASGRTLDLLAIDEAQFFGPELIPLVGELALRGMTVVISGLCVTFDGDPFEPLPSLMALAEDVVKLAAVCAVCGEDAAFHQHALADDVSAGPVENAGLVGAGDGGDASIPSAEHVGGIETYQARCRRHFTPRR